MVSPAGRGYQPAPGGRKKEIRVGVFKMVFGEAAFSSSASVVQGSSASAKAGATAGSAGSEDAAVVFCGHLSTPGLFYDQDADEGVAAGAAAAGGFGAGAALAAGNNPAASEDTGGGGGGKLKVSAGESVCGGNVRVAKIAMDLTRRGVVALACCSSGGATLGDPALLGDDLLPVDGFVAEYDFLGE